MKQKYDRLSNENKKTGGPTCPTSVRRAKLIARSDVSRANAVSLGMEVLVDNNYEPISNNIASTSDSDLYQIPLGARHDSRNLSTRGVKRRRKMNEESDQMLNTVCLVANKFSVLADAITNQSAMNVESIVREEVKKKWRLLMNVFTR